MEAAHILILTYGTRGDVEPFVAIALRLKERGHKVTLGTAEHFGTWISAFGLDHASLTNALLDIIHSEDGKMILEGGSGFVSRVAAGIRTMRKSGPINTQICLDAWRAAQATKPDLILYHHKVIAGPHIAEALGVPAMLGLLQPMIVPTSAFPAAGLPRLPIPGYNRLSYRLVAMSYASFRTSVNRFRTENLGLSPVDHSHDVLMPAGAGRIKVLHAVSPLIIPRPTDWPAEALMTGYWWLPPDQTYAPPKALAEFLAAGEPPVYVGFGSMTTRDPAALGRLVVDALKLARIRGVIGSGWAGIAPKTEDNIVIGDVPHSWLFPRMRAVVHHGGAGTTAAGFRAGIPTVICPFFGDPPAWAERSVTLGVSAAPIPRRKLTPERLAASMRLAISDPDIRSRAQKLGAKLATEDGIGAAASQIEKRIRSSRSL